MVVIVVRCKNCNNDRFEWAEYNYSLKVNKPGTPKRCNKCNNTSNPTGKDFEWWFCSKKCLLEYLNKTKESDYKYQWEM